MCQHKAQKVERFVGDLVQIVSYGQVCSVSFCGLRFYIGWALDWLRGGHYAVGSGIVVSSIVSHLPGAELDIIISIPHYLLSTHKALIRNRASASCVLEVPLACPHTLAPVSGRSWLPRAGTPVRLLVYHCASLMSWSQQRR